MKVALLAVFRNESHILEEFIRHYLNLGINRFYLTDNASTDDYHSILKKYKKFIKLHVMSKHVNSDDSDNIKHARLQRHCYAKMLRNVEEDWALICDLDEFFYMRKGWSLNDLIRYAENENISQIVLPLKVFTSGGLIEQPNTVRDNFFDRVVHSKRMLTAHKMLVKKEKVRVLGITHASVTDGYTTDGDLKNKDGWHIDRPNFDVMMRNNSRTYPNLTYRHESDEIFKRSYICGNHYFNQSREFYFNIKSKRGVIESIPRPYNRTTLYERRWHKFENMPKVKDYELYDLVKQGLL